jgi:hypothetical protein
MAESAKYWIALPADQKQYFYNIAAKSDGDHTAFEFFHTEIPDVVKHDPEGISILLDGGEVTVPVDGYPGPGPGQLSDDTITVEMPDRDMSRVVSGENGGDYTPDNVVLEDAGINRSRQAADMSDADYQSASDAINADAEIIANRVADTPSDVITQTADTAESIDLLDVLDTVGDVIIPLSAGYTVYKSVSKSVQKSDATAEEQAAIVAVATGGSVAGMAALCLNPVTGPVVGVAAACIGAWKLFELVGRAID